ncbi:MAG: LON peptidase substrate-binding domain-containing protein [Phycisphaeraceae bacterium]
MAEAVSIDFSSPVPLFPLANCALLPHAVIPLHIFESRYRRMVADALEDAGLIAMAVYENARDAGGDGGDAPLRPHVCLGRIVRHEQLPDGRYNMLLQGICRARVVDELEHDAYRVAMLEPTEYTEPMEIDLSDARQHLEELLHDELLKQLAAVHAINNWLNDEVPTAAVIDLAVLTLCHGVEERYAMLAEPDPEKRAAWLEHHLQGTRRTLRMAQRLEPAVDENGLPLN